MTVTTSLNIVVGSYVSYKDTTHVVVELRGNLAVILNPTKGNAKLQVAVKNLVAVPNGNTVVVEYQGNEYIVTHKFVIISLRTGRVMNWADNDGNRVAIIKLRDGIIGSELMESWEEQQAAMEAEIDSMDEVSNEPVVNTPVHMYRVSTELRCETKVSGNITAVLEVKEQCGSMYYFKSIEVAAKAAIEMGTGIDVMSYNPDTRFADEWFK